MKLTKNPIMRMMKKFIVSMAKRKLTTNDEISTNKEKRQHKSLKDNTTPINNSCNKKNKGE